MLYKDNIIVIGASTGGPKVLFDIFSKLAPVHAAVIIIQHILPKYDSNFVACLNGVTKMNVALARDGSSLETGTIFVAPAGLHLCLEQNTRIKLLHGEKVNYCCPSIDVAMKSLVHTGSGKIVGIVLTGMGNDGSRGITHIKKIHGVTIAQDKKSSVIYGMPMQAQNTGDVDFVLSSCDIGQKLIELVGPARP
jgi:two-component system chemotaxis response regulator CheB